MWIGTIKVGATKGVAMMQKLVEMKTQLSELATILNAFKSEAVQLRILEIVLGKQSADKQLVPPKDTEHNGKTKTRRKRTTKKTDAEASAKPKKVSASTGAYATLNELLSGAFFDQPRTIGDIVDYCRVKLARVFKPNEFSGKLGRMVRSGELTRDKNMDHQYEYKKPS